MMLTLGHYHQAYELSKRALKIKFIKKLNNINRASQEWLTNNLGAESYDFLCKKALKKNNLKLAYCISKKGAKHFPDDDKFKAHLNKIRKFYAKKRDLENALQVTLTIHQHYPNTEATFWNLCKYQMALDRKTDALSTADQFLAKFPTSLRALKTICHITYKNNDPRNCIKHAKKLAEIHPTQHVGHEYMFKIFWSLGRSKKALVSLSNGLKYTQKNSQLLQLACNIDLSSKHRRESIEILERLIQTDPFNDKYHNRKLRLLLSHGSVSAAKNHAGWLLIQKKRNSNYIFKNNGQGKELDIFTKNILSASKSPLYPHWIFSYKTFHHTKKNMPVFTHQAFQYWSQGDPPKQILRLTDEWNYELNKIGLNNILLFDHNSALAWISENTPEFIEPFRSAFHYAVEADIFRIAYATKNDCIWIDADMVISKSVSGTLAQRILSADTTLYIREREPGLSNGFFATKKSSPFFMEIMNKMKNYSFSGKTPSKDLVLETFGTSRYTDTLAALMEKYANHEKSYNPKNPCLNFNNWKINFVNKATFGRSKPSEGLDYFITRENWNNFVGEFEKQKG